MKALIIAALNVSFVRVYFILHINEHFCKCARVGQKATLHFHVHVLGSLCLHLHCLQFIRSYKIIVTEQDQCRKTPKPSSSFIPLVTECLQVIYFILSLLFKFPAMF